MKITPSCSAQREVTRDSVEPSAFKRAVPKADLRGTQQVKMTKPQMMPCSGTITFLNVQDIPMPGQLDTDPGRHLNVCSRCGRPVRPAVTR